MSYRANFSVSIFLLAIIGALFCKDATYAETTTLKIGVLSGLSGAAARWNRYQNMGITLAQEELRAEGFEINLIFEDSQT